jgi:hypothetical protein
MPTFDDVRRLGATLPEVTEAPSYHRMPALKVRGKPICRLWSPAEHRRDQVEGTEVVVVFCDPDEKELLIDGSGGALFSTPHYAGYPALLIRLADISIEELAARIEDSYRARAPRTLIDRLPRP